MAKISVLGLGAMGSRMAANLLKAGHAVTVWNRTPAAASALVEAGAKPASSPREAVKEADLVFAMVRDDEASRHLWLATEMGALDGMKPGAIAIESSTLTPGWTRELAQAATQRGIALLEAPVAGSRPQAEAAQLVYFVGGDAAALAKAEPVLKVLGRAIHHVGPVGSGALVKLATNALMGVQVTALAEIIGLLKHGGADVTRALEAIAGTPAWSPAAGNLSSLMLSGNFAPQFPVDLIEKDFGYAVQAAGSPEAAPTLAAARGVFQTAKARGFAEENMTSVVKLFTR